MRKINSLPVKTKATAQYFCLYEKKKNCLVRDFDKFTKGIGEKVVTKKKLSKLNFSLSLFFPPDMCTICIVALERMNETSIIYGIC